MTEKKKINNKSTKKEPVITVYQMPDKRWGGCADNGLKSVITSGYKTKDAIIKKLKAMLNE